MNMEEVRFYETSVNLLLIYMASYRRRLKSFLDFLVNAALSVTVLVSKCFSIVTFAECHCLRKIILFYLLVGHEQVSTFQYPTAHLLR
jgi:hypothetical protein